MANLSNINNKFLVTTGGNVLIGQTSAVGSSIFQVTGNSTFAGDLAILSSKVFKMYNAANNAWAQIKFNETDNIIEINRGLKNSGLDFLLSENSANSYVCANEGNFGIGTDSPDAKLQIQGNIKGGSASGSAWTDAKDDIGGLDVFVGSGSKAFQVWDDNNQTNPRFVVERAGNVGIGTTSPGQKLEVSGNTYVTGFVQAGSALIGLKNGYATLGSNSTATGIALSRDFLPSSYPDLIINSTGNVGIGTASPSAKLQVQGTNSGVFIDTSTAYTPLIKASGILSDLKLSSIGNGGNLVLEADCTGASIIQFNNGGSERMRIDSSGNVGIGTTTVQNKFVVRDTGSGFNSTIQTSTVSIISKEMTDNAYHSILQLVAVRQSLTTGNASNGYLGFSTVDDSNNQGQLDAGRIAIVNEAGSSRNSPTALSFWTNPGGTQTTAAVEKMRIDSSGDVGIGETNPTKKIDVYQSSTSFGAADFRHVNGNRILINPSYNYYDAYNHIFRGLNGTDTHLTIDSSGNVGIGTTSPVTKLEIYGNTSSGGFGVYPALTIKNDNTSGYSAVHFNQSTNQKARIEVSNNTGSMGLYTTATANGILINASGNVGIGNTNPQAALDISSSYSIQGGVYTYYYTGTATGQSNINLDITVNNEGGGGNVFKIEAGFAHYYDMSHNSIGEWWCTSRGTNVTNTYILNAGSANAGTWSSSKLTTSVLRITKSAGTYVGGGKYWVKVTYRPY